MAYTYRISRRLALAHLVVFGIFLAGCGDSAAPTTQEPPSASTSDVIGSDVAPSFELRSSNSVNTNAGINSNVPAGFTTLSDRPFNAKVEMGWRDRGDKNFSITSGSNLPASPSTVGKATFPAGYKGGSGPINTWYGIGGNHRNLYISFYVKFSSNWQGHKSGMNKIFFFIIDHYPRVVLKAYGSGSKPLEPWLDLLNVNENPVSRNLTPNLGVTHNITRGQWAHWELVLRANTSGQANGQAEWWVDGVRMAFYNNINFVKSSQKNWWEELRWNPTWGGVGDVVQTSQDMQIDNIYVAAQ